MELICQWDIGDQWVSCASVIYVKKALQETYEGPETNRWWIQDFPRRGSQLPGGGGEAPTCDFVIFSQKLHEIERIWAPDPPLQTMVLLLKSKDVFTLNEAGSESDFTWKTASA